jgi:hypothetical protein
MISMILLMLHLVEPTNEDGARPKVTGGPSVTPIELPPTYRAADQEGRTCSLITSQSRNRPDEKNSCSLNKCK